MNKYKVWIADRFTKIPLAEFEITALTKWGAKTRAFKEICRKNRSYVVIVSRLKERDDNAQ